MTTIVVDVEAKESSYYYYLEVDGVKLPRRIYFNSKNFPLKKEVSLLPILGVLPNMFAYNKEVTFPLKLVFKGQIYKLPKVTERILQEVTLERYIGLSDYIRKMRNNPRATLDDIVIEYDGEYPEIPVIEVDNRNVYSSFSFGKESLFNRYLCGHSPVAESFTSSRLLFLEYRGYNAITYSKYYQYYPELDVISTNLNHVRNLMAKSGQMLEGCPNFDTGMYWSYLALQYSTGTRFWSLGNEVDCTRPRIDRYGDMYMHYTLFDEGNFYETLISTLNKTLISNGEVFSMLAPIYESKILELLKINDPGNIKNLIGCWFVGTKKVWCGQCGKCHRYAEMFKQLNMPLPEELERNLPRKIDLKHYMTPKDLFSDKANTWYKKKLKFVFDPDVRQRLEKFYTEQMGPGSDENIYSIVVEEDYNAK